MNEIKFNAYPIFEADQVLTADHLNDFVNYLDEQNRLSRNKLLGIGICCGLEYDYDPFNFTITVHEGVGVTSEGFLIVEKAGNEALTCFKAYDDPNEDDPYRPFLKANGDQIDLFELEDTKTDSNLFLNEFDGVLSDYVLLLFVECYDKTLKNCVENDCLEKGKERIFTVRRLLVSRTNAQQIIGAQPELNRGYRLPAIQAPRFKVGGLSLTTYEDIFQLYFKLINNMIGDLESKLPSTYQLYASVLAEEYNGSDPFLLGGVNFRAIRNSYLSAYPFAIQYLYDFFCDLVEAYQEFRQAAFDYDAICCPPADAFPKHLFLGPIPVDTSCIPSRYRTPYIHTPKHDGQDVLGYKVRELHKKIIQLILNFKLFTVDDIRITPSRYGDVAFSRTSIPYYYQILQNGALLRSWNPDLSRKCRWDENLSYYASNYSNKNFVTKPLDYDIGGHNFYRIEGHIGEDYQSALKRIITLRQQENLAFDIVAVKLGSDSSQIDIDDLRCSFQDLQVVYDAWAGELECVFSGAVRLISSYKVKETIGAKTEGLAEARLSSGMRIVSDREPTAKMKAQKNVGAKSESVAEGIIQNIDNTEGTYGYYINKYAEFNGRTGREYYFEVAEGLQEIQELNDLTQQEYKLGVEYPVRTTLTLVEMAELIAEAVDDTDIDKLIQAEAALRMVLEAYAGSLSRYNAQASRLKIDQARILQLLWILDQVCALQQLIMIRKEIERRKRELQQLQLFAGFVSKNPGIAHRGGVPRGGTFVLVYHEESPPPDEAVPEKGFPFRGRVLSPDGGFIPGVQVMVPGTTSGAVTSLDGTFTLNVFKLPANLRFSFPGFAVEDYQVTSKDNGRSFRLGSKEEAEESKEATLVPPNKAVVLDFFLPYLCCSDCPSITYVFEEPAPELGLEPTNFCVPFEGDLPTFRVVPDDATISGEGVVEPGDSEFYRFDPNVVDLGEDIFKVVRFRLNGKAMPLSVTVFATPVAAFSVEIGEVDTDNRSVVVTITNGSENAQRYEWDYGDGTGSREEGSVHEHQYDLSRSNNFAISLRALNGECENTRDEELIIEIPEEDPTLDLTISSICVPADFGPNDIPLIATPAGAIVTGPGVVGATGGPYFFDPNSIDLGSDSSVGVEFQVNGVTMPDRITLFQRPEADFTVSVPSFDETDGGDVVVTFTNLSRFYNMAQWTYGDGNSSSEMARTHTHTYVRGDQNQFTVRLLVFNELENCTDEQVFTVVLPTPTATIRERRGRENICNGGEQIFIDVSPAGGILRVQPGIQIVQENSGTYSFIASPNVQAGNYKFTYSPPTGEDVILILRVSRAPDSRARHFFDSLTETTVRVRFTATPETGDSYRWFLRFDSNSSTVNIRGPFPEPSFVEPIPRNVKTVFYGVEVTAGDCVFRSPEFAFNLQQLIERSDNPTGPTGPIDNPTGPIDRPVFPDFPIGGGGLVVNPGGLITTRDSTVNLNGFGLSSFNSGLSLFTSLRENDLIANDETGKALIENRNNVWTTITSSVASEEKLKALKSGEMDRDISEKLSTDLQMMAKAMIADASDGQSRNTSLQAAYMKVFSQYVGLLVNVYTVKDEDFKASNPLSKVITVTERLIKRMKDRGINVNTGNDLVKTIRSNMEGAKPKLEARLNTLIETIVA